MQVIDNGSGFTVMVSRRDVEAFKAQYPCSGLPDRAVWFAFDKQTESLEDMSSGFERFDGPALLALSEDAQTYGVQHLHLDKPQTDK